MARNFTPDRKNADGSTTVRIKRCCNGCGKNIGDVTESELEAAVAGAPLPDVRKECGCLSVLDEIKEERKRQDRKWGVQNHPNGTGPQNRFLAVESYPHNTYKEIADNAIGMTDNHARRGDLTYADIFLEEVFEAMAESDPEKLRVELIQCAAVAVAWAEKIDRDEARA